MENKGNNHAAGVANDAAVKYSVGAIQCRHEKGQQEYDDNRSRNKTSTSRYFWK